ncbi:MAG: ribosome maturation factor RimM [Oscillospiraceae bacterium]|jgi:16S rRNA processing protein RimM|nr:ribosome maturation factor RimM [Oscillospiraceae bacterium]
MTGLENKKDEHIEVGKIMGLHGLKGDIKIYPWCDDPAQILDAKELYVDGVRQDFFDRREHKRVVLTKIEGINTPEAARKYVNKVIYIRRSEIKLEEGEFLIRDLLGLNVIDDQTGVVYGKIFNVIKTGSNDVYEIKNEGGAADGSGKVFLIPAIKSVVKIVDLEQNVMRITPIKGLFDDENSED